jgi:hypothetical protein
MSWFRTLRRFSFFFVAIYILDYYLRVIKRPKLIYLETNNNVRYMQAVSKYNTTKAENSDLYF